MIGRQRAALSPDGLALSFRPSPGARPTRGPCTRLGPTGPTGESLALVNSPGCSCGRADSGERPLFVPRYAPLRSAASARRAPKGGRRPAPLPYANGLTARRDALCIPPPRLRVSRPFATAAARRALRLPGAGLTVRAGRKGKNAGSAAVISKAETESLDGSAGRARLDLDGSNALGQPYRSSNIRWV